MKTILASLILILLFSTCVKEEIKYSCDPVLNGIITNHKKEYSKYSLKDLTLTYPTVQRAIFRTYDPEKKREVWLEKIQYLLNNENYSEAEIAHISKLITHLQAGYFNQENLLSGKTQRSQFASEWISYAIGSLGWDERYIAFVVYRLYTTQAQMDAEITALKLLQQKVTADGEGGEDGTCNCNAGADFCEENYGCLSTNCSVTSGCGWLWAEECNGQCH
jgi:hypothetical protein